MNPRSAQAYPAARWASPTPTWGACAGRSDTEAGVEVAAHDLIAFATLSAADLHTILYPNGDETHCFAVCVLAERWNGEPRPDGEETTAIRFADPLEPPLPLHPPTRHALQLLIAYLDSGSFQLR